MRKSLSRFVRRLFGLGKPCGCHSFVSSTCTAARFQYDEIETRGLSKKTINVRTVELKVSCDECNSTWIRRYCWRAHQRNPLPVRHNYTRTEYRTKEDAFGEAYEKRVVVRHPDYKQAFEWTDPEFVLRKMANWGSADPVWTVETELV